MIIISNTSPLIALQKINKLTLLEKVFRKILIPDIIYKELTYGCSIQKIQNINTACNSFIEVVKIDNINHTFKRKLDLGEINVLSLALDMRANLILIDDRKAFNEAKELGFKVASTLTFLKVAQTKGFIDNHVDLIEQLKLKKFFIPSY
jgi:uncharacterized protein